MAPYALLLLTAFCQAGMFLVDADKHVVITQVTDFHQVQTSDGLLYNSENRDVVIKMDSPGCKCTHPTESCSCCSTFSTNNLTTDFCAVVQLLASQKGFHVSSTIDGEKLLQTNITERGVNPLCSGVGSLGQVCLEFYDIDVARMKICFRTQINFLIMRQSVNLGCTGPLRTAEGHEIVWPREPRHQCHLMFGDKSESTFGAQCFQCSSETKSCRCCRSFKVTKFDVTLCGVVKPLWSNHGFSVDFTFEDIGFFTKEISEKNPKPICLKIPKVSKFATLCIEFYSIDNDMVNGCTQGYVKILGMKTVSFDFGCFSLKTITKELETEALAEADDINFEKKDTFLGNGLGAPTGKVGKEMNDKETSDDIIFLTDDAFDG